jgi:hypothetical protein
MQRLSQGELARRLSMERTRALRCRIPKKKAPTSLEMTFPQGSSASRCTSTRVSTTS